MTGPVLRDAGLPPTDYSLKIVGGVIARVEALSARDGDAALLVPLFEPKILAAGGHILGRVDEFYPDFPGQGLVVRQSRLKTMSPIITSWLEALREARLWALDHPEDALSIVMEETALPAAAVMRTLSSP